MSKSAYKNREIPASAKGGLSAHEIFGNAVLSGRPGMKPTIDYSLALASLLELRFAELFKAYREDKIDIRRVKAEVIAYMERNAEKLNIVFDGKITEMLENFALAGGKVTERFYAVLIGKIRRADELKNPLRHFVLGKLKPKTTFDDQILIKHGGDISKNVHTPNSLLEVLKLAIGRAEEPDCLADFDFLRSFAEGDSGALRFFNYLLLKTFMEAHGFDLPPEFKIEKIPLPTAVKAAIHKITATVKILIGKIWRH